MKIKRTFLNTLGIALLTFTGTSNMLSGAVQIVTANHGNGTVSITLPQMKFLVTSNDWLRALVIDEADTGNGDMPFGQFSPSLAFEQTNLNEASGFFAFGDVSASDWVLSANSNNTNLISGSEIVFSGGTISFSANSIFPSGQYEAFVIGDAFTRITGNAIMTSPAVIPEPSSAAMFVGLMAGVFSVAARRRRKAR